MTIYARYEELQVTPAPDDTRVDVAGMMREVRDEVEATTLRDTEEIVAVEPWGIEARLTPPAEVKSGDAVFESRNVYSYRVTIDLRPVIEGSAHSLSEN